MAHIIWAILYGPYNMGVPFLPMESVGLESKSDLEGLTYTPRSDLYFLSISLPDPF